LELLKEESYFFKLSKYQDKLLEFYKQNPEFISPVHRRDEIINRINEGLKDLSITRKAIKWGVPFSLDKNFVLYVWVDALLNYITALGWPKGKFKKYWPADLHIVGKEINWFHTVIWPAMLFSVGVEKPKKVFAHGWLTLEGQKISKSLGNVIDPVYLVEKYGADAVRYYIIRQIPFGEDGDFSEKALIERINGELVADLGNLVYRVLTLAERFDGKIEGKDEVSKNFDLKKIDEYFEKVELHNAIGEVWNFIRATNKYINEKEPWKLKGKGLGNVLYNLLEAVRIISILISPFLPESSERINKQLGVKTGSVKDCKFKEWKGKVKKGKYLFQRIE
jgi:methionyl-tRNA synthetase